MTPARQRAPTGDQTPPLGSATPACPRTLGLFAQALIPLALQLGRLQLGQLVAELLVVHQRFLLLLPLLLQLGLQRVHLALQLGDVPLGLWREEGRGHGGGEDCVGPACGCWVQVLGAVAQPEPPLGPRPLTSSLIFSSSARSVSTSLFKVSIWRSLGTEVGQAGFSEAHTVWRSSSVSQDNQKIPHRNCGLISGCWDLGVSSSHPPPVASPDHSSMEATASPTPGCPRPHLSSFMEPLGGPNVWSKRSATTCHSKAL